ncbi:MAG: hypothetical protein IJN28_06260 [Selenomonadales bacterium]|nr:hypothetical protein [Selenomonadales bacterium]
MFGFKKKEVVPVQQEQENEIAFAHEAPLKPCQMDSDFFLDLWDILHRDGGFLWVASIGTEDDILGDKGKDNRASIPISTWEDLENEMRTRDWVDAFSLVAEVEEKGTVTILFRNFVPATGYLVVAGNDEEWVDETYDELMDLFYDCEQQGKGKFLYSKPGFGIVQSVIPLVTAGAIVVVINMLLLYIFPELSLFFWYLTTASILLTLKIGVMISNRMLKRIMHEYPYLTYEE